MPDTGNARKPPANFSIYTIKTWLDKLIWLLSHYSRSYFVFFCIELVALIRFLQIWVAIYVYGTTCMINWSSLIKKLMQTIVIISGSVLNVSTIHLNGIWHLIWRYLSKPVLGRHPVLSGHYSIPQGCPLNTGFTVLLSLVCTLPGNSMYCLNSHSIMFKKCSLPLFFFNSSIRICCLFWLII